MIPNIVHFIYPVWPRTRPLSYLNYMAVKMASEVQKPDAIKFWINKDPEPNEWWDRIKELVDVVYTVMDAEYRGVKIEWPQLQSDVTRLEILRDEGGIYLDTDMLLLRPLDVYLTCGEQFIIGYEPGEVSLCNALMMAEPNADFVNLWLDKMPEALQSDVWAQSGVIAPFELYEEYPTLANVRRAEMFCPFDLTKCWMFMTDTAHILEAERLSQTSFAVHGFETFWRDVVKDITPEWCEANDSFFSRITAPYRG